MCTTKTDESIVRALEATKLLVETEKKFFEGQLGQAPDVRMKIYRLRLRKKLIATQITMLNILEEERRKSAGALGCQKCGLFLDPNESLHFCVALENASTTK